MTPPSVIVLDGQLLTTAAVAAIAAGAPVALAETVRARMSASAAGFDALPSILVQKRKFLVGDAQGHDDLVKSFVLGHCAGVGEPLPAGQVRAMMACRVNVFAVGHSGVRPALADAMIAMINAGITPVVPSQGSVGAAGDLSPLAHVARPLCGFGGDVTLPDGTRARNPLPPFHPTHKEALALINGATLTAALGAIAVHRAERVLDGALDACALTMAALRADPRALSPRLLAARRHSHGERMAAQLRIRLGTDRPTAAPDAFSIRAAPAVLGAAASMLDYASRTVTDELNGACDNPLWFDDLLPYDAEHMVEGGNFHGAPVALAMDALRIGLTTVATQSERRTFRLTASSLTGDLPSFLVEGTGLNSGFMLAQYTAASLASECKGLSHPASVDSIPTVQHHEDHVSMGPIAARLTLRVLENLADIVAIELLLAAQALDFRLRGQAMVDGRLQACTPDTFSERILGIHRRVREIAPFWQDDQVLHPQLVAAGRMVRAGELGATGW